MNDSIIQIMLDMQELNNIPVFYMKKGDTARRIILTLSDCGFPYKVSPLCQAALAAKKPDGEILFNYCAIDEDKIIYDVTSQMTNTTGTVRCEIRIIGPDNEVINSADFLIVICDTVTEDELPEDTASQICEQMEQVEQSVAELTQQVEGLPTVTEQTVTDWGFTKNTGSYTKPVTGIPESDLATEVQLKLNTASTADAALPDNLVLYEETTESEDSQTVEALLLDKLALESDGEYIYLKYGAVELGRVEAGSGVATVYCTGVTIQQENLSVNAGDTTARCLTAAVTPADCTQPLRWVSDNTAAVQIDSTGALTILGEGTATITARCGSYSDTVTVTVVDNSVPVYFGYCASWSYSTPASPLLGANTARGYSSALASDQARQQTGDVSDTDHTRAISIEPGCTYQFTYSGTDTNWYVGYCILSGSAELANPGWMNIGASGEITISNTYDGGIYLYLSVKYGTANAAVTAALISEFNTNTRMEKVV